MDKEITLLEALTGSDFDVTLLSGEVVSLSTHNHEIITPNEAKTLKGKGMPFFKDPSHFGNLYIHFRVVFPKSGELSAENLKILSNVFCFAFVKINNFL